MQPLDFSPIANAPLQAMQAAAYGDAMQANRLQNRLVTMAAAEDQRKKSVAGLVAGALYGPQQAATPMQQPVNQLAGPHTGQHAQAAPQLPPVAATPGTEIMAQVPGDTQPTNQLAGQPAAPAAAPTDPFTAQRMRLRDLYNAGQITAQDAMGYDQQITAAEHTAKEQKAKETLEGIKLQVEQGKLDEGKQKLLMGKLEPMIRAMTPVQEEYERLIAAKTPPEQAIAAVQPMYEGVVKTISSLPGFEDVAKSAAPAFNPAMAYLAKDTYAAIERRALAGQTADAKAAAAAEKSAERTPVAGVTTPSGKLIFTDKNGQQYVDGKPYTGKVSKTTGTGGGGSGSPGSGTGGGEVGGLQTLDYPTIAKKLGMRESALKFNLLNKIDNPTFNPYGKYRGQVVQRTLFDNAFGVLMDKNGIDPDKLMMASKEVKADTKAYVKLNEAYELVNQAVEQSRNNANLLLEANDKYKRGDYPAPNKFANWAAKNMSSKEYAQFELSLLAFSREYMRVVTGAARSVSELSVGAQSSADEVLSKFASWDVMRAKITQAQKEVDAVPKSYETRMTAMKGRMGSVFGSLDSGGPQQPTEPAADTPPRIGQAAKWITSDMRGRWADTGRQDAVYKNLKGRGYSDAEIGQAFKQAKGGM